MAERTRRHPQKPLAFWGMVALATVVGLAAAGLLWLKGSSL